MTGCGVEQPQEKPDSSCSEEKETEEDLPPCQLINKPRMPLSQSRDKIGMSPPQPNQQSQYLGQSYFPPCTLGSDQLGYPHSGSSSSMMGMAGMQGNSPQGLLQSMNTGLSSLSQQASNACALPGNTNVTPSYGFQPSNHSSLSSCTYMQSPGQPYTAHMSMMNFSNSHFSGTLS